MNLKNYVSEQKKQLAAQLVAYLQEKQRLFANEQYTHDALRKLEIYAQQGKMLRGILVILSYELCSQKKATNDVLSTAVAVELTQSGALIHDDIMDQDTLRRGHPTIHTQYTQDMSDASDPLLYGASMGICLGDLAFFMAFELLGKMHDKDVSSVFSIYMQRCVSGQIADVTLGQSHRSGEKDEILQIYLNKTGYYSLVMPLLLGAHLANADQKFVVSLEEIGKGIGIIFQIKDDLLGLLGDEKETGKVTGNDIRENKKTLIRLLLFTRVSQKEKQQLESIFGNKDLSAESITYVKTLFETYGIAEEIDAIISSYTSDIEKNLALLPQNPHTKLLDEFYHYNLTRKV